MPALFGRSWVCVHKRVQNFVTFFSLVKKVFPNPWLRRTLLMYEFYWLTVTKSIILSARKFSKSRLYLRFPYIILHWSTVIRQISWGMSCNHSFTEYVRYEGRKVLKVDNRIQQCYCLEISFINKIGSCSTNQSVGTSRLLCIGRLYSATTAIWPSYQ
jgi:hypothetical protein